MSAQSQSIYRPLDVSRRETRLLKIVSDQPGRPVECQLHRVSLDNSPVFVALSYVWGNPKITEDIIVNGQRMAVTRNLETALRHARRALSDDENPRRNPRIWADAICINQKDAAERSSQVQHIMRLLYQKATIVICWLGPPDESIIQGLKAVRDFYEAYTKSLQEIGHRGASIGDEDFSGVHEALVDLTWMQRHGVFPRENDNTNNSAWDRMMHLDTLPYWKRVWIFQEIALAQHAVIVCGDHLLYYSVFQQVQIFLSQLREQLPQECPAYIDPDVWMALKIGLPTSWRIGNKITQYQLVAKEDNLKALSTESAWDILQSAGDFEATDPRDFVYGFQGILQRDIIVDYTLPVVDVFKDLFRCYLGDFPGRLTILHSAGVGYCDIPAISWPSWTPSTPFLDRPWLVDIRFDLSQTETAPCARMLDRSMLEIEAVPIDVVLTVQPEFELIQRDNTVFCNYLRNFCARGSGSENKIPPILAILRVLMRYEKPLLDAKTLMIMVALILFTMMRDASLSDADRLDVGLVGLPDDAAPADLVWKLLWPHCEGSIEETAEQCAFILEHFLELPEGQMDLFLETYLPILGAMEKTVRRHRIIETPDFQIGLAPPYSRPGDVVCMVKGYDTLAVLRPEDDHFLFVGDCFVDGFIYGEAQNMLISGEISYMTIVLK